MEQNKNEDFSKTTMWKKSIAAEKARANSWTGRVTLVLLTLGGAVVFATAIYFALR